MPSHNARPFHEVDQSALYMLRGLRQLADALCVPVQRLEHLASANTYRVWVNDKNREIQAPFGELGRVHRRIDNLLSRILMPDYNYSRKGRSYIDNARFHAGNQPVAKTDINKFYPSTTLAMVREMWIDRFCCARDVASLLAKICCYSQKHLPTGSPLSGRVAFWAARPMLDEVYGYASKVGIKMSVIVDDITLSGPQASKRAISHVRSIVRKHGLKTKASKTKTFSAHCPKTVTGVVIYDVNLRLPNVRHLKIKQTRNKLATAVGEEREVLIRSLKGRLSEALQVLKANKP